MNNHLPLSEKTAFAQNGSAYMECAADSGILIFGFVDIWYDARLSCRENGQLHDVQLNLAIV
jgi:hypothetical protein